MKMIEEFTLRYLMKKYKRDRKCSASLIHYINGNMLALMKARYMLENRADFAGVIGVDVITTDIYKHEAFLRRLKANHPEYFL